MAHALSTNTAPDRGTSAFAERNGLDVLNRSLRRHWRKALIATACLSAATITILSLLPPKYSANAYLMVESRPNVVNIQDVAPALTLDVEGLASQVEILRSREIASAVAERLHLTTVPGSRDTKMQIAGGAIVDKIEGWLDRLIKGAPLPPEERVITYLLTNESVRPMGRSRVVEIRFTAGSPQLARNVANAFAEAYIDRQVFEKTKASISAKNWVDGEIIRIRQQVESNEHKLEDFRARSGLLENGNRMLLPYGEIADIDRRLTAAQTEYGAIKARADEVQRLQRAGTLSNALPETIGSPALQALREREARLSIERATLMQQYGPDSVRIQRIEGEMQELKAAIRTELSHIADGLNSEAALSSNEVASLKAAEASAKSRLESSSGESVGLLSLQREVAAGRDLLVTLLRRQNELAAQVSLQTADAQLISPAPLPVQPAFPKMLPMSVLAVFISAILSVAFYLWRDLQERLIRSTEELAALVPYPTLGMLPRFQTTRSVDQLAVMTKDRSRFAEAVKNLYIRIAPPDRPLPRSVVVTSALSGEGKTTTAVSMAMLAASLGRNVVLVDFDTRRPSLHHILRLPLGPGVMEYLSGECSSLNEVIQHPMPNLAVVTAGRGSDFNNVVRTELVENLLKGLTQKFDHVIIDTPPSLAVVDPLIVARLADRVIHVVRWADTTRESVKAAVHLFESVDPRRIGAVLAQVDIERHAADGYGDSIVYHKSLNRYYLG